MADQYFSIREQVLDVQFSNRSLAHALQNRLSRLYYDRLMPAMNEQLEALVPEDIFLRFDTLTIDLGDIPYEQFEQQMEERLVNAFRSELQQQLRMVQERRASANGEQIQETISGDETLLEHFLLHGSLPWWRSASGFSLDEIIQRLFERNATGLRAVIIRLGQYEYIRRRLVFQLGETAIRQVVQVLEPVEASFIFGYHRQLLHTQEQERVVQSEAAVFAKEAWVFIITYLVDDRGSEFNRKSFVKRTLAAMAAGFNVSYTGLLQLFQTALIAYERRDVVMNSLEAILNDLFVEAVSETTGAAITKRADVLTVDISSLSEAAELLRYYFTHGTLPVGYRTISAEDLTALFGQLAARTPQTVTALLAEMAGDSRVADRFYTLTGQRKGQEILSALYPSAARTLLLLANVVNLLHEKRLLPYTDATALKEIMDRSVIQRLMASGARESEQVLVQQVLADIATHRSLDLLQWIAALHDGIRSEFRQGIIHATLPAIVETLYAKAMAGQVTVESPEILLESADAAQPDTTIYNLLLHLVRYGHIPWWGKQLVTNAAPGVLFTQLAATAPQQVMQLIRQAGLSSVQQHRMLYWLNEETWENIWSTLPSGGRAVRLWHATESILSEPISDTGLLHRILLLALWDNFAVYSYRSFSVSGFFSQVIQQLSLHTGTAEAVLLQRLEQALTADTQQEEILEARRAVADLLQLREPAMPLVASADNFFEDYMRTKFRGMLPDELFDTEVHRRQGRKDSAIQSFFAVSSEPVRHAVWRDTEELLRYYLAWNTLPARIPVSGEEATRIFIAKLFKLAYATDSAALLSLVRTQVTGTAQVSRLAGLFNSNKGGVEKDIHRLLTSLREGNQGITTDIGTGAEILADALSYVPPALLPATGGNGTALLSDVIQYFFTYSRLPDNWILPEGTDVSVFLKKAFAALYASDRSLAKAVLSGRNYIPSAVMFFYELFSEAAGGTEKEIVLFLQPYRVMQVSQLESISPGKSLLPAGELPATPPDGVSAAALVRRFLVSGEAAGPVLLDAVRKLFTDELRLLGEIVSDATYSSANRMKLYEFIMTQHGAGEKQLLLFAEHHWQSEAAQVLDASGEQGDVADAIIARAMQQEIRDIAPETWLLSIPVLQRLLDARDMARLARILTIAGSHIRDTLLNELFGIEALFASIEGQGYSREALLMLVRQFHLQWLSGARSIQDTDSYRRMLFSFLRERITPVTVPALVSVLQLTEQPGTSFTATLPVEKLQLHLRELIHHTGRNHADTISDEQREAASLERKRQLEESMRRELEGKRIEQEEALRKEAEKMEEDKRNKIYIRNAGLVLFHPFLSTFFTRVGLMENSQFTSDAAKHRAVILLQYLAYGRPETDEFELPLNKILCGVPVNEPVPPVIELTEQETAVSEELFQVIFQRWEKMKNTSVAGFRASFIQREGALSRTEENWELKVEQRTYDLLLSTLPWGISMIRYPWMNQLLTVEWT